MYQTLPHGPAESGASPSHRSGELGDHTQSQEIRSQTTSEEISGVALISCALGAGLTQCITLLLDFKVKAASLAIPFLSFTDHLTPHNT